MTTISYSHHRFPPEIIQYAVWLYYRFALSLRDVEDLLTDRGIDFSYETVRRWTNKFDPAYARRTCLRRPRCSSRWHLDEVFVRIGGKLHYFWRAVDDEGEVLDVLMQSKRNQKVGLKLMRKQLKRRGFVPDAIATDRLRSYGAALRELGLTDRRDNWRGNDGDLDRQAQRRSFCPTTQPSTISSTSRAI